MQTRTASDLLLSTSAKLHPPAFRSRRTMASSSAADLPVVAVIGTTGVGKSKLSIQLAQHIARRFLDHQHQPEASSSSSSNWNSAEVINADSMQIYKGLDVITNKVTLEEMEGIHHRVLGIVDPRGEKGWGMAKWVEASLDEISDLHSSSKIPIITGGTTYWIQHLLFPLGKPTPPASSLSVSTPFLPTPSSTLPAFLASLPTALTPLQHSLLYSLPSLPLLPPPELFLPLHQLLEAVDPKLAAKWHWKDARKVMRSLERIWAKGERESEVWKKQEEERREVNEKGLGAGEEGKRYRTLIFWLHAPTKILDPRLDSRVDKMVDIGLLDELRDMRLIAEEMEADRVAGSSSFLEPTDYVSGIFQSIGYKEFSSLPTSSLVPSALPTKPFQAALDQMKLATRQYARSQVRWITAKLRGVVKERTVQGREGMFLLDAGDLSKWDENVLAPALSVLDAFLDSTPLPSPASIGGPLAPSLLALDETGPVVIKSTLGGGSFLCPLCSKGDSDPFFVMYTEGTAKDARRAHERGKVHQRNLRVVYKTEMADVYEKRKREAKARKEEKERLAALTDTEGVVAELDP